MNTKGLLYPNPCPHCGKENTKKGCYEFFGKQNGRKYGVCMRGASPATGWEQAYESDGKTPRGDRAGNSVYQEIIPYEQNGGKKNTNKKLEDTYYYPDKADNPLIKIDCYSPHPSAPQMKCVWNRGQTILESGKEKESTEGGKKWDEIATEEMG